MQYNQWKPQVPQFQFQAQPTQATNNSAPNSFQFKPMVPAPINNFSANKTIGYTNPQYSQTTLQFNNQQSQLYKAPPQTNNLYKGPTQFNTAAIPQFSFQTQQQKPADKWQSPYQPQTSFQPTFQPQNQLTSQKDIFELNAVPVQQLTSINKRYQVQDQKKVFDTSNSDQVLKFASMLLQPGFEKQSLQMIRFQDYTKCQSFEFQAHNLYLYQGGKQAYPAALQRKIEKLLLTQANDTSITNYPITIKSNIGQGTQPLFPTNTYSSFQPQTQTQPSFQAPNLFTQQPSQPNMFANKPSFQPQQQPLFQQQQPLFQPSFQPQFQPQQFNTSPNTLPQFKPFTISPQPQVPQFKPFAISPQPQATPQFTPFQPQFNTPQPIQFFNTTPNLTFNGQNQQPAPPPQEIYIFPKWRLPTLEQDPIEGETEAQKVIRELRRQYESHQPEPPAQEVPEWQIKEQCYLIEEKHKQKIAKKQFQCQSEQPKKTLNLYKPVMEPSVDLSPIKATKPILVDRYPNTIVIYFKLQLNDLPMMTKEVTIHKSRDGSDLRAVAQKWVNEVVPLSYDMKDFMMIHRGEMVHPNSSLRDCQIVDHSRIDIIIENNTRSQGQQVIAKSPKPPMSGYSTQPSFKDILKLSSEQLTHVPDFAIWNEHGKVEWFGEVDLTDVDLGQVTILHKSVEVFPNESPALGTKLNKPGLITLYNIVPEPEGTSKETFSARLKAKIEREGGTFISYENNTWVIKVPFF